MGKSTFPIKPHISGHLPPPSQGPADSQSTTRPPTPHLIPSLSLAYATIDQGRPYHGRWSGTKDLDARFGAEAWLRDARVESHITHLLTCPSYYSKESCTKESPKDRQEGRPKEGQEDRQEGRPKEGRQEDRQEGHQGKRKEVSNRFWPCPVTPDNISVPLSLFTIKTTLNSITLLLYHL